MGGSVLRDRPPWLGQMARLSHLNSLPHVPVAGSFFFETWVLCLKRSRNSSCLGVSKDGHCCSASLRTGPIEGQLQWDVWDHTWTTGEHCWRVLPQLWPWGCHSTHSACWRGWCLRRSCFQLPLHSLKSSLLGGQAYHRHPCLNCSFSSEKACIPPGPSVRSVLKFNERY